LMEWLPDAIPAEEKATLVHGDFRLDNLILTPDKTQIAAVLDWELSTLGDPLADFTYHLMQWQMPKSKSGAGTGSLLELDLAVLGIPDLEAYVQLYCQQTGRDTIENLNFYFAYNFFRLAAILQGIVGRVRDGTATNTHAKAMASRISPLAKTAWRYATLSGAGS
jgi:aminoglycoside phosphotransferase (APT) family kinase protein